MECLKPYNTVYIPYIISKIGSYNKWNICRYFSMVLKLNCEFQIEKCKLIVKNRQMKLAKIKL